VVDLVSHSGGWAQAVMNEGAVTLPQVLLLSRIERRRSAPMGDLAEASSASGAALSQMIERLAQQGLIIRAEDAADRRRKTIRTTPRARALLRKLEAARAADYELGLRSLAPELQALMTSVLEEVAANLESMSRKPGGVLRSGEVLR
jgi:DNA-binding MarR family transcriptional regulator